MEGSNRADLLPGPGEGGPELMPVLRHGPTIAHMVDTAMSSTGEAAVHLATVQYNKPAHYAKSGYSFKCKNR